MSSQPALTSRMFVAQSVLILSVALLWIAFAYNSVDATQAKLHQCEHPGEDYTSGSAALYARGCLVLGGLATGAGLVLLVWAKRSRAKDS